MRLTSSRPQIPSQASFRLVLRRTSLMNNMDDRRSCQKNFPRHFTWFAQPQSVGSPVKGCHFHTWIKNLKLMRSSIRHHHVSGKIKKLVCVGGQSPFVTTGCDTDKTAPDQNNSGSRGRLGSAKIPRARIKPLAEMLPQRHLCLRGLRNL